MKFFILFISINLGINYANAQNSPSKDEIISWLASKINNQGIERIYFHENDKDFFYQYYNDADESGFYLSDNDGTNGFPKNQYIDFHNIKGASSLVTNGGVKLNGIYVKLIRPIERSYNDGSGSEYVDHIYLYMDWEKENNLLERMKSALIDLGNINSPPVKEVY